MTKLCIAGNRGHLNYVFDDLQRLPEVHVVGICSGAGESELVALREQCSAFGFSPRAYDSYDSMLDSEKPDVIVVCGPFEAHAAQCAQAFHRGIGVYCEKPVALSLSELNALREAYNQHPVPFASMMGLRYDPAFYTAWELVSSGRIGDICLINAQKSYKLGNRPAYYQNRDTYGGTIPWVGSHAVDWIHWFSGARPFRSVTARQSRLSNGGFGTLETSALCQFELEGDVLASATIDFLRPSAAQGHGDDRVRVIGTRGAVEVRSGAVLVMEEGVKGERSVRIACDRTPFADFIRAMNGGSPCLLAAHEVFAVGEACLFAQASADERSTIYFGASHG